MQASELKTPKLEPRAAGVYYIRNTVTGMLYVGSAMILNTRLNQHRSLLRSGRHPNSHLQRSWNKHGATAFEIVIAELVPSLGLSRFQHKDAVLAAEQRHLDEMRPYDRRRGFNNATKAEAHHFGLRHSVESKLRISRARKGKHTGPRGPMPEATKRKLSAALRGRPMHTKESRRRIGEASRLQVWTDDRRRKISEAQRGKVISPEQRAKISASLQGKTHSKHTRRKLSVILRAVFSTEEQRRRRSDKMKEVWTRRRASMSAAELYEFCVKQRKGKAKDVQPI